MLEVKLKKTSDILVEMEAKQENSEEATDSTSAALRSFVEAAKDDVAQVQLLLSVTKDSCSGVINFFGEDAEMPFTQVSQLLGDFLNALAASKDKIRRQKKNKK